MRSQFDGKRVTVVDDLLTFSERARAGESSMAGSPGGASLSFTDHVLRLMERVEHRIATAPAKRDAAFRLRYDAYRRIGFLPVPTATSFMTRATTMRPTPG
jgi:hypothetical protein